MDNDLPVVRVQLVHPPARSTILTKLLGAATWLAVAAVIVEIVTYPGHGRRDTPNAH